MLTTGDPYIGSRSEDIERKNKRIGELEMEVKQLKAQIRDLESRYVPEDILSSTDNVLSRSGKKTTFASTTRPAARTAQEKRSK